MATWQLTLWTVFISSYISRFFGLQKKNTAWNSLLVVVTVTVEKQEAAQLLLMHNNIRTSKMILKTFFLASHTWVRPALQARKMSERELTGPTHMHIHTQSLEGQFSFCNDWGKKSKKKKPLLYTQSPHRRTWGKEQTLRVSCQTLMPNTARVCFFHFLFGLALWK